MDSEGLSLPWIHKHPMMPWNDLRKGVCCRRLDSISEGYYCKSCDFFIHKKCGDKPSQETIQHQSHPVHPLELKTSSGSNSCDVCRRSIVGHFYRCQECDFDIDLYCVRYTPPDVIDVPEMHHHRLTLFKERIGFRCAAKCGKTGYDEFPYKCDECDIAFHIDCVWYPELKHMSEVNHSYHPWHSLKLVKGQLPDYSDGKCRLCERKVDEIFYHCSSCNFTLDMRCVFSPPPQSLLVLKAHDHQLTLLRTLCSFTCNACGTSGDRSPYICIQCDFMIHQSCLGLPNVIKINRHHHRIARTSILDVDVMNSVCGVCLQKVDWTCGGYSCERCPGYVVHSKCATRKDVWNGKELEGVPEEIEDLEPYVVIDDNTIQHFSHKEHYLRLYVNGIIYEEDKRCNACTQPIALQSFYGCMDCDFILHQDCAMLPKKKWHVLHNDQLTLVTSTDNFFDCDACGRMSNGFMYQHGERRFDVQCTSNSEPFFHLSHLHHPLYYIPSIQERRLCNGCNLNIFQVLTCIEDGCGFFLCFECATLPPEVKHRVDNHPLSLCYGEKASGKYWCDICEKETDPKIWFYTCKDHQTSLHIKCVVGHVARLMPKSTIKVFFRKFEVILNKSMTRPICRACKLRCIYPIILKRAGISGCDPTSVTPVRVTHPWTTEPEESLIHLQDGSRRSEHQERKMSSSLLPLHSAIRRRPVLKPPQKSKLFNT